MKKRIDDLLNENLDLDPPKLLVSVKEVNVVLKKGEAFQDSFRIGTAQGQKIRGRVASDNHRIVFAKEDFKGSSSTIIYGIDSSGLEENAEISGNIILQTNVGEFFIPVHALVEDKAVNLNDKIENLDDFVRIASKNEREAFRCFADEGFLNLLTGENEKYRPLYRAMSQNPVAYQHMEEFLISCGKKKQVTLSIDKKGEMPYILNSSIKDTLHIYKSCWGYTQVEVQVQGDFIEVEKKLLTSDDFIGRVCGLEFILNRDKLKGRHCIGKIILKTVYEQIEFKIEASPYEKTEQGKRRTRKQKILKILRSYLDLQLKKTDYRTWYTASRQWINEIKKEKQDCFTIFAEAYLAACQEEKERLAEILWPVKNGDIPLKEAWQKAAYLYLAKEAGILPAEERKIAPRLYECYRQAPGDYLILELYLRVLEKQGYDSPWGLSELEKVYNLGCRSPFLYLRAWKLLSRQESLLRKLSPFLIRVLHFAQKEGLLTRGLLMRAAFLSLNLKQFDPSLYQLLSKGYETYPEKEVLEAICRYIMYDRPTDEKYFPWYEKAVEQDVRLTRLYEYYIETRPETLQKPLPMAVKLYFSYTSSISDRRRAYLYACVMKEKETDPLSYENYERPAQEFTDVSLKKAKINEWYAALYREFYSEVKDVESAGYISEILFTHKLVCKNSKVRKVLVCHPALKEMQTYMLNDGIAYIQIYSKDVCIYFEDEKKHRFQSTVNYEMSSLMDIEKLAKSCMLFGVWNTGLQLYCCSEEIWKMEINKFNLRSFWKAAENPDFTRNFRDRIRRRLLDYFQEHSGDWELITYAQNLKELTYGRIDKERTFEILIHFGQYRKAFNLISSQGCEGIKISELLKLADFAIRGKQLEGEEELLDLVYYIYKKGCFTEEILSYLARFGVLSLEATSKLWKNMRSFNMDTYEIEEKFLCLSMFLEKVPTESEEILERYTAKKGKPNVRRAYLIFLAMLYVLKDRDIGGAAARGMKYLCYEKGQYSFFAALAWVKYKAFGDDIEDSEKPMLRKILDSCMKKQIRLDFFHQLPEELIEGYQLEDKVFAQINAPAGSSVEIHYRLEGLEAASQTEDKWKNEPMRECIQGLYTREFLLFFGEKLSYYCTVREKEESFDTPVYKLKIEQSEVNGKSKYQLLNRVLMLRSLEEKKKAEEVMEQYLQQEAYAKQMFQIIE